MSNLLKKNLSKPLQKKIHIALLYGGRSEEHEISLISAASVLEFLDKKKYKIVPIGIEKNGQWRLQDLKKIDASQGPLRLQKGAPEIIPFHYPKSGATFLYIKTKKGKMPLPSIDLVFPVLHGSFCEDGRLQGLLDLSGLAYVGCGVLASAMCMDKEITKLLAQAAGIPIVPYLTITNSPKAKPTVIHHAIQKAFGYPVFIKPANSGSSVGVEKVKTQQGLGTSLKKAFLYDTKILIEKAINAREIEIGVLENPELSAPPLLSPPAEILPKHEFYSYSAKYTDKKGAEFFIPAPITKKQLKKANAIASTSFQALQCEGLARVDLFLDRKSGAFYLNEINTLPGFTSISMFPKLWGHLGISFTALLDKLIVLAFKRQKTKSQLTYSHKFTRQKQND